MIWVEFEPTIRVLEREKTVPQMAQPRWSAEETTYVIISSVCLSARVGRQIITMIIQ
jgi:hypothetical protein